MGNKLVRLTESDLHRVIKESVNRVLNEIIGGSSANGYAYDWENGGVSRNQGGAFGGSSLDKMRDEEQYRKEQEAKRENYNRRLDELIDEYESRGYSFEEALKIAKEFLRMGGWTY